jgi:hypothetical protein
MGSSPRAELLYGVELGINCGFEYDALPDWFDQEEDDWTMAAEMRLLAASGFTESDCLVEGYFARKSAAEREIGVQVRRYGCGEDDSYLLAAVCYRTTWDSAVAIPELAAPPWADSRLAWAVQTLGVSPKVRTPGWLLTASYW